MVSTLPYSQAIKQFQFWSDKDTHKDTTKEEVEMISMCAIKNQNINVGAQSLASTQMLM